MTIKLLNGCRSAGAVGIIKRANTISYRYPLFLGLIPSFAFFTRFPLDFRLYSLLLLKNLLIIWVPRARGKIYKIKLKIAKSQNRKMAF